MRHLAHRQLVVVLASTLILAGGIAPAAAGHRAAPGAAEIGDPLFPGLGNGGYDVLHYALDLRYATSDPAQPVDGDATIIARATQDLSSLNLDFAGGGPRAVSVDGRSAAWRREGEELVVTPKRALRKGRPFTIKVAGFTATPTVPDPEVGESTGFFITPHGTATAPQPDLAHQIFPSNDHPRDKASFTISLDVPRDLLAVANGVLAARWTYRDRTHWHYVQRQPMATQLIQLAVGGYDFHARGRHGGVDVRDVTAPTLTALVEPLLPVELEHLDWMEARVGRYPFDTFGSFVVDVALGFALETQTMPIYDRVWFTEYGRGTWDPTMLHELTHMWFGDDVALWEWSDLWLSEGHATWYEFLYAEERGMLEEDTENYPDETGYADFDDLMRAVYAHGDEWRAAYGPVARPASAETLFSFNVYHGGALVLYALRQEIGVAAFERLEREWLHRYGGRSASSDDFIRLASRVARRDLRGFLEGWLYGATTPPMPGHPDWTVNPVEAPAPLLLSEEARATHARPRP